MALTSASTDAQVWAEFDDNADYEANASRAQCLAFRTACRYLMRRRPTEIGRGNRSVTMDDLRRLYDDAGGYLKTTTATSANGGSRVRYLSMENFQG